MTENGEFQSAFTQKKKKDFNPFVFELQMITTNLFFKKLKNQFVQLIKYV